MKKLYLFFLFLGILLLPELAFAQPDNVQINLDHICEGRFNVKFKILKANSGLDDHIDYAQVFWNKNDGSTRQKLATVYHEDDDDYNDNQEFSNPNDDDFSARGFSNDFVSFDWPSSRTRITTSGDDEFVNLEFYDAWELSDAPITIEVFYVWRVNFATSSDDVSEGEEEKDIQRQNYITSSSVTANRNACDDTKVELAIQGNTQCADDNNYHHRVYLYASNSNSVDGNGQLSGATTIYIEPRAIPDGNKNISLSHTEENVPLTARYYQVKIEYYDSPSSVIRDSRYSGVIPVAAPTAAVSNLNGVSNDNCNNQIELSFTGPSGVSAPQTGEIEIYRATTSLAEMNSSLHFGLDDMLDIENLPLSATNGFSLLFKDFVISNASSSSLKVLFFNDINLQTDPPYVCWLRNGEILFSYPDNGNNLESTNIMVSDNVPFDLKFEVLYENGQTTYQLSSGSTSYSAVSNTNALNHPNIRISHSGIGFIGSIDQFGVYNTPSINFEKVALGQNGLLVYYEFDDGIPGADNSYVTQITNKVSGSYSASTSTFTLTGTESNFVGEFFQLLSTQGGSITSFVDNNTNNNNNNIPDLINGQPYVYVLRSKVRCSDGGNPRYSKASTYLEGLTPALPEAPSNIQAQVNTAENHIEITWTDNTLSETIYRLVRKVNGTVDNTIELAANVTSYADDNLAICQDYTYSIEAVNTCGTSSNSTTVNTVRIDPDLSDILVEDQFDLSLGYFADRVELVWQTQGTASQFISSFRIFRRPLGSTNDFSQIDAVPSNINLYRDETADPGVFYEYKVVGEANCSGDLLTANEITGIGFSTASGLVSGQVTYEGNIAVEGVKILVNQADGVQAGNSLKFDGIDDRARVMNNEFMNGSFTIEMWAKRNQTAAEALFGHGSTNDVMNTTLWGGFNENGQFVFSFAGNDLITTEIHNDSEWHHWVCTYDANSLERKIYKDGEMLSSGAASGMYMGMGNFTLGASPIVENTNDFSLPFMGNLDEVRIWSSIRTSEEIARDHDRILNPNEPNLMATWSFEEKAGDFAYDRSKSVIDFNKNHLEIFGATNFTSNWGMDIPSAEQLSIYAITDVQGNYVISSIPFQGVGENFTVTPQFLTHEFSPSQTNLFIGAGNQIYNNINFTDISSFPVTGTVFFENSSCPSPGVGLAIDGQPVTINGEPVLTNDMGFFSINVPIGQHVVTAVKEGHTFSVGRFPEVAQTQHNFQEPVSGIEFIDNTSRIVMGRVVGGTKEGNKKIGFGKSVNNIGKAKIVFRSVTGNGCDEKMVETDPQTGEYTISLLPLKYTIEEVAVLNSQQNITTTDFGTLSQLDLGTETELNTVYDTLYNNANEITEIRDASFHKQQNFIYRKTAELSVMSEDGITPFIGEFSYQYTPPNEGETATERTLVFPNDQFTYPIFIQGQTYTARVSAFEFYQNYDDNAPIAEDRVPIDDGTVHFNNNLATNSQESVEVDAEGIALYTFTIDLPSADLNNTNANYSFTKTMDVTLERPGQTEDVKWYQYPNEVNELDRLFRAYVLGAVPTTNIFTSAGPQKVEIILRDPPGSNSFAYLTRDSSYSKITSTVDSKSKSVGAGVEVKLGSKLTTGAGVEVEFENQNNVGVGVTVNEGVTTEGEIINTTSFSSTISTKDDTEDVGAAGDLYIAKTININMAAGNVIGLVSEETCSLPGVECVGTTVHNLRIGRKKALAVTPTENGSTKVIYSQNNILNYIIPNLKAIRNNLFVIQANKYIPNPNLSVDDPKYGTNNDDPVWGNNVSTDSPTTEEEDKSGSSYTWVAANTDEVYGIGTDSVRYYNQQIKLWERAIWENEKDKVNALNGIAVHDISISGGAVFANEVTTEKEETKTTTIEYGIDGEVATVINAVVAGTGVEFTGSIAVEYAEEKTAGRTITEATTWGYEINDPDQGDLHNIRTFNGKEGWGPVFQIVAGQTGCPHEDEVVTQFYQPGTVISNRTAQRDKVAVEITPGLVQNIPAGDAATFTINLNNLTETNDVREFAVAMRTQSNPNGASVSMDGETIAVPQELTLAPGITTKTITVERGPVEYNYDDLELLFYVPCQYQAGAADEVDIVDTARFSVHFLPDCTDLRVKEPLDQWVLNNSNNDTLPIIIDEYNVNYNGLEGISLQYKPASQASWIELERFWHNSIPDKPTYIPNDRAFIRYNWDMAQNVDGDYNIRALSLCELNEDASDIATGHADRINPHPFGTPEPSDGICSPGEDLEIEFNETIDIGSISLQNFDIRGVLNGTELRHSESLTFDGTNDYMEINNYSLNQRSFAVEFWAKRNAMGEQVLFSQGTDASQSIFVGFDAQNRFKLDINGTSAISSSTSTDDQWHHYIASYDKENATANLIVDGVEVQENTAFNVEYSGEGAIQVGKSVAGTHPSFNGNMHELRLWGTSRTSIADIVVKMNKTLSATTTGLIGNWQMNEGFGNIAEDEVRSRHATINGASWLILPEGKAFSFNGTSDYLEVPMAGAAVLNKETDITFEVWFKANTPGTLFSNGKADGVHDNEMAWAITMENDGKIAVYNDGNFIKTPLGYMDDNWHHFAFVLDRNSSMTMYVDGEITNTGNTDNWNTFAGSKFWVGCRGWFDGTVESRDQYFGGSLDDVRLWNTARKLEQVQRDFRNRLKGDEFGLVAYYPFEHHILSAGVPILQPTIDDESENSYNLTQGGSTALNHVTPPAIKLQRPIEKVNFIYSINNDRIILTPTDPSERLENVTLDVTVKGVKDLYGNVMQSPATWIAYMDKNQVFWQDELVQQELLFNESGTFTGTVVNSGGSIEQFQILNLPAWLTASPASGTIAANSTQTINFTIQAGVNIGQYDQDIFLVTDFGFNERLLLDLNVKATAPDWEVNPSDFEHFMSYIGQLNINNVISTDVNDRLVAFVGNEVRGVTNVVVDVATGKYLVFLNVYSNAVSGEQLDFKIWDASEGRVYDPVTPQDHTFVLNDVIGTRNNPQIFSTIGQLQQAYSLSSGWSWLSFPLESPILPNLDQTLQYLNLEDNDYLVSQDYFDLYYEDFGWFGSLSSNGGLNRQEGYKINLANAGTFTYSGNFLSAASTPIALEVGWNWIGMISQENITLEDALASLNPSEGDIIKSQHAFAIYEEGLGWGGSLSFLEPTKGYMIKVANADVLTYPGNSGGGSARPSTEKIALADQQSLLELQMNVQAQLHPTNMSLVATIEASKVVPQDEVLYLAAYRKDVCQGISPLTWKDGQLISYMTLHGANDHGLRFEILVGATQEKLELNEQITFVSDKLVGSPAAPFVFTLKKAFEVEDDTKINNSPLINESVAVYPNPFQDRLMIQFELETQENLSIRVQDINGKEVATITEATYSSGQHKVKWDVPATQNLAAGVYFIHIQSETINYTAKVVR